MSSNLPNNVPKNVKNIINDFVLETTKLLGKRLKIIYLYGSYARGDFRSDSDIDIMILTDAINEELEKISNEILYLKYDIEEKYNFDYYLSPLVKNINEFNYWLEALPFYMNIKNEGVLLNE